MKVRHLILDRDGVLNQEAPDGGYLLTAGALQWLPNALEGLAKLRAANVRISVATNQSAVGRGLMTQQQLKEIHDAMSGQVAAQGGSIDAWFSCTHAPDAACWCRKPAPGLVRAAIDHSSIAPEATLVVGDSARDLEAAWRAGVSAVLLQTGKGRETARQPAMLGVRTFQDLGELADAIARDRFDESIRAIEHTFEDHMATLSRSAGELPLMLERIARAAHCCLQHSHKILVCGNGGSAADAQHFVAELVGRFREERPALAAVALSADSVTLTALANDYGFERVFARQIEALANEGDLLILLSTSGNSPNIVRAAQAGHERGCTVAALTGAGGGLVANYADLVVRVPSTVVARIQEVHQICIHAMAETLDQLRRGDPG